MRTVMPIQHGTLLRAVPWSIVKDHEARAMANHSQTLDGLAERSGMDPTEMLKIILDEPLFPYEKGKGLESELKLIAIIAKSQ